MTSTSTSTTPALRIAGPGDILTIADNVTEAFDPLKVIHYLVPNPALRPSRSRAWYGLHIAHAIGGAGQVVMTEDGSAAAVWFDRTGEASEPEDYEKRLAQLADDDLPQFLHLERQMDTYHPRDPHWHLLFAAVRPGRQNEGLGSLLLDHTHKWLDTKGYAAYLEATGEDNERLHQTHGYQLMTPPGIKVADGVPNLRRMWRPVQNGERMARTTGTKAQRDDVRLALDAYGATPEMIAVELQRRFGLRPREAFRQSFGWTQDQVAAKLNACGAECAAFTGARISDYERWPFGGRRPSVTVLTELATLYSTAASALVDLDDLTNMPVTDRTLLGRSLDTQNHPASTSRDGSYGRDLAQGIPLSQLVKLENETDLVIAVTERVQDFGAWNESSNIGPATLEDIAESTRRIARDYLSQPPLTVYGRAGALADRVFWLLRSGHQPSEQSRELYRWAGYLCSLLAWMAGDLGHPAAAESQIRTAWTCTEPAADPTLRAWVLSTMSKVYLWDQRYERGGSRCGTRLRVQPAGNGRGVTRLPGGRCVGGGRRTGLRECRTA